MHRHGKFISFDYLKGVAIVLIILMHAVAVYSTYGPVEQSANVRVFDYIVAFIDSFAIPVLFLISGFFVWPSLKKHGAKLYVYERLIRLGIPWVAGIGIQKLLDMTKTKIGFSGPLWFLIVLIFFDVFAILIYFVVPNLCQKMKTYVGRVFTNPLLFFLTLLGFSWIGYKAMLSVVSLGEWVSFGPIIFDASRILLHFSFFIAGMSIGAFGIRQTIFSPEHESKKIWWLWLIIGIIFMMLRMQVSPMYFPLSIVALVFASIGFFHSYCLRKNKVLHSISRNDYGIYIFHFIFVTGLQYVLVGIPIPAVLKGILVFTGALAFAWSLTILLRKIHIVREVI